MEYEYTVDEDYPEGARAFESSWTMANVDYVASDAGEDYFYDDPNPEEFPLELELFNDGISVGKFEIFLEFTPTFSATGI